MWLILLYLLLGVVVLVIVAQILRRVTVLEYERGLQYTRGRFKGVLGPGAYWHLSQTMVQKVDMRQRVLTLPGQEILSADGAGIKITLLTTYEVADPQAAVNKVESYLAAIYADLQAALREVIGALKIDEILGQRQEIAAKVRALAAEKVEQFGVRLVSVSVKDMMFPGEFKKIFAQVVRARQEGLAALERARGESAALRSLANAARVIEGNPALMQLRLLQVFEGTPGNTLKLNMSPLMASPVGEAKGDGEAGIEA